MRKLLYFALSLFLTGCGAPLTQTVWVPIDASQGPYFSQVNAQCNLYARNVAAGINMPSMAGPNAGNTAMQALLGGLFIAVSADDAYNECMYAAGWQLQTRYTTAGLSNEYYKKALTLFNSKQWPQLEELAKTWIAAQPSNPTAYSFYANALIGQAKYTNALTSIDKAISLGSKDPSVYGNRGIVNRALKKQEQAIGDFDQCLAINPSTSFCKSLGNRSRAEFGFELSQRREYAKAIEIMSPAVDAGDQVAQLNTGVALSIISQPSDVPAQKKVRDLFESAAKQGNAAAQYNLFLVYSVGRSGVPVDKELAIKFLEQSANQNWPNGQYFLALQYLPNGLKPEDKSQAKIWLERAVANKESTPDQVNRAKAALAKLGPRADPYWIQATNTNCKLWNPNPLPDEKVEWNGSCVNGMADGSGSAKWIFSGGSYSLVKAQFKEGRRIDGPAENTDTRTGFITKGTFVNGKLDGPVERINIQSGAVTRGNMIDGKFAPN